VAYSGEEALGKSIERFDLLLLDVMMGGMSGFKLADKIRKEINANEQLMSFFSPVNSRDNIRDKFYEVLDDALLQFVNHKLELYNKLTEDKANSTLKRLWFNELYDRRVRGIGNM